MSLTNNTLTNNINNNSSQDPFLCIINNLLTTTECRKLISKCNSLLSEKVDKSIDPNFSKKMFYSTHFYDDTFCNDLFSRIKEFLPVKAHGFLPKLTLSMYNDYGYFPLHQDVQYEHEGMFTQFTLNIFLNGRQEFDGGETDFLKDDKQSLRYQAVPESGRGALFEEKIWHRGNTVTRGKKYLLRAHILMPMGSGNHNWEKSIKSGGFEVV